MVNCGGDAVVHPSRQQRRVSVRRERIVGNAPATPSDAEAAALPFDHHHCLGAAVRSIWRHARETRGTRTTNTTGTVAVPVHYESR